MTADPIGVRIPHLTGRGDAAATGGSATDLLTAPLLVVSPHPDDAALSCAALLDRERPVDIATVFTGAPSPPVTTEWDRAAGFADSDEAMAARMAEERAAFADSPHRLHELGELDGQYVSTARDRGIANVLRSFVSSWRQEAGASARVVLPVGAGRTGVLPPRIAHRFGQGPPAHPDHIYVRDMVLVAVHPCDALLYEEFPYMHGRRGDRAAVRAVRRFGYRIEALDLEVDRESKLRRLAAYGSQLETLTVDPSAIPESERYYRLVAKRRGRRR